MAIKGSNPAIKAFYQLLGNTIVAGITNNTVWFALIFYTYLETRSVIATSVVSGIYLVASAVSGVWFGGLVDRYQKKRALVGSGMASLVFYALGLAVFLAAPEGAFTAPTSVRLWVLVVLLLLGVIAGNVRGIALPTIVTLLIPENKRDRANGLAGTATGIAFVITSAISGVLVGSSGMVGVLILAMVLMATSVLHLLRLPIPEQEPARKDGKPAALDVRGTVAIIAAVPGLLALIGFTTLNNLLGGVFMGLMDAYGLSLVSVQIWGILWAFLSLGFIIGGLAIARWGLGKNPLAAMFAANLVIWTVSSLFTIQPSIVMLTAGMFVYLCVVPFIEAAEHTIMQRVVPQERQGRAFGFAHSVESAASPVTTLLIGPVAELVAIPFMTNGVGADLIGGWFGTGADRGIALVFTLTGIIGLVVTLVMMNTRAYRLLSACYMGTAIRRSRRGTIATVDLRACSAGAE
jgi:DHA3 family multidrug efflux protein-like MFS transporter